MRYYIAILIVFGLLAAGILYAQINSNENSPSSNKTYENKEEEILNVEPIDAETEALTLSITNAFLDAFITYDQNNPIAYVEEIEPFVTEDFLSPHQTMPKREPLEVISYSWNKSKSDISLVNAIKKDEHENQRMLTVYAEIVRIKKTDTDETEEDKDYWIELKKVDDIWLVSGVSIEDGKQYKYSD